MFAAERRLIRTALVVARQYQRAALAARVSTHHFFHSIPSYMVGENRFSRIESTRKDGADWTVTQEALVSACRSEGVIVTIRDGNLRLAPPFHLTMDEVIRGAEVLNRALRTTKV